MRQVLLVVLFVTSVFGKIIAVEKFKYKVSVASVFKDEGPYLREWIEYYLLLGVEHFYLYNNHSTDDFREVLNPYIERGIVELFGWDYSYANIREWGPIQTEAFRDAVNRSKKVTDWLAIIDIDEFIVPKKDSNLKNLLKHYDDYAGLMLHWQMFGHSDLWDIPQNKLLIEALVYRTPSDYQPRIQNIMVVPGTETCKTIAKPRFVKQVLNQHRCRYLPGHMAVTLHKKPAKHWLEPNAIHDIAQINHYWCRTKKAFEEKIERNQFYNKEKMIRRYEHLNENATVHDKAILKFVNPLKKRVK